MGSPRRDVADVWSPRGSRGWRVLRRLLPEWYRTRWGAALLQAHVDRAGGEDGARGPGFWTYLAWDVALTAAQTRWRGMKGGGSEGVPDAGSKVGSSVASSVEGVRMEGIVRVWTEVRLAARGLVQRPVHGVAVVVTLALGLGVTTAVASVLHAVVLAPVPYEDPDGIVQIARVRDGRRALQLPPADVVRLQEALGDRLDLGVSQFLDVGLSGFEVPVRVRGVVATGTTQEMLGVSPFLGRLLQASDDVPGGACVTVLAHGLWQEHFGADPGVIGTSLRLDGAPCFVVGVMPAGFEFPGPYFAPGELWLAAGPAGVDWHDEAGRGFLVFGRRATGVGPDALSAALEAVEPVGDGEARFVAMRWAESSRTASLDRLAVLLAAAALVLLIACANVAALQLARAADRQPETATRMALGATPGRLVRNLMVETGLLTALGAAAGLVVALVSVDVIVALRSFYIPRMEDVSLGGVSVAVCLALAVTAGLVSTVVPALRLLRGGAPAVLRGGARGAGGRRGARRFGNLLVATETALALVLLAGASLLMQSYRNLNALDPGFPVEGLLHARVTPPPGRYPDAESRATLYARLEREAAALPGVRAVALAYVPPGVGAGAEQPVAVGGDAPSPYDARPAVWRSVSPGWFHTLGMTMLEGEGLAGTDPGTHSAVVNEAFVRRHFPDGGARGANLRRISTFGPDAPEEAPWTIVGVVSDVHEEYTYTAVPPAVYVPLTADPPSSVAIVARTDSPPLTLARPVRLAVVRVDPELPVFGVRDLAYMLSSEYDLNRLGLVVLALFSGAALLLSVAGVHGVVAHAVERRMGEIGIRVALGALRADVLRLVLRDCAAAAAAGSAVGIVLLLVLGDGLATLTPGWVGLSPPVLAAAAVTVTAIALAAAYLPARRALSADPVETLRRE